MANDNFDDVDHLMKALSLDGVRYRDFSGRANPPKLKLIGGRREALPAEPPVTAVAPPKVAESPRSTPFMPPQAVNPPAAPVAVTTQPAPAAGAEPTSLPDESLQATFSRLIARAPQPQPRKLKLELQLPPRRPAVPAAETAREQAPLGSLFERLSGRAGLTTPKKTG